MTLVVQKAFLARFVDLVNWDVRGTRLRLTHVCHWPLKRLGEVSSIRFEIVPSGELQRGAVLLLDRVSFDEGRVFAGKRTKTRMTQYRARPGDIVVSKINARKRAIGIVPDGPDVGITIHFRALTPTKSLVEPEFLWQALRSSYCTNQFEAETGGIGKGEISESKLLEIQVPLPPLETQRAILAEWRKAKAEIAKAEERARQAEAEIPELIYAALGTPAPEESKAHERLMVLRWSDLERWSFGYLARKRAGLLGFSKSKYPIRRLGEYLLETANGYCIKPVSRQTPFRMLKLSALKPEGLDLNESKFVDVAESVAARFCPRKNDLLICRSNAYEYVAKCSAVDADLPAYLFPDIMIRARIKGSLMPAFVGEVINTPLGRSFFQANSRRAVGGMWKIGADDIANFPIPVPPVEVQQDIVKRVGAGRARIAREREAARETAQRIEADLEAWLLGTKEVPRG